MGRRARKLQKSQVNTGESDITAAGNLFSFSKEKKESKPSDDLKTEGKRLVGNPS